MAKYLVDLTATASTTITVEADNPDDAADKAYAAGTPTLCAQCSGWNNPPGVELSGDWEVAGVEAVAGDA
jgi:hypothetical protein